MILYWLFQYGVSEEALCSRQAENRPVFCQRYSQHSDDEAIVQSIMTLAHSFNLKAITEGVEDKATADV
jgi:hypothetical protein